MVDNISNKLLREMRLANNGLINKFDNIDACVKSLFGVQCQYQMYGLISLYNRVKNIQISHIVNNENLVKIWGMRSTLHIMHKQDWLALNVIYSREPTWIDKKCKKMSVDSMSILQDIHNYMKIHKSVTKKEIENILNCEYRKELLQWGGVLMLCTLQGFLYGSLNEKYEKRYIYNVQDDSQTICYNDVLSEMLRRYFTYYGPASKADFSHWAGLPLKAFEEEFGKLENIWKRIVLDGTTYYYTGSSNIAKENYKFQIRYPVILGKFDPLLVCYENKKWILDDLDAGIVWRAAGQIEGIILGKKGILATWRYKISGDKIIYLIELIKKLTQTETNQLDIKFRKLTNFMRKKKYDILYY